MFSGQLPPFFDPRKYTDQGVDIQGQTSVGKLPRLADFRDSQNEVVEVDLHFGRDEDGRRSVKGTIRTNLTMPCQRCLEPVTYQIQANVELVMVWTEEQMKALPEHLDPLLVTDEKMPLADLLEEELLLALPLVAMHEHCPESLLKEPEAPTQDERQAENPFAVLAQLKRQQD